MKSLYAAALLCAALPASALAADSPAAPSPAKTSAPIAAGSAGPIAPVPAPSPINAARDNPADEPAISVSTPALPSEAAAAPRSHPVEVEVEYLRHHFYNDRHINNYTVHLYQEMKRNGTVSFWRGLTATRAKGYLIEDDGSHRDSDAWGLGPSFMIRWEKPVGQKWAVGLDGTGSLLAYNHAFPAGGRAFGFMWRVGPRVSYYPNKDSAIRLGWSFVHCSNGFSSRNPGYNGSAFSLMYAHNF